jgi:hypothetical protein
MAGSFDLQKYAEDKGLSVEVINTGKTVNIGELAKGKIVNIEERAKDLQTRVYYQREWTATFLAYVVSIVFCIVIALPFIFFLRFGFLDPVLSEFIKTILPSITTLLGVAFGFYFSIKRLDKGND